MTLNELTSYYGQLLAYQYRGKPNALRQIQLWSKQAVADFLANQLLACFDIDAAVGTQLDVLGKYVGVPRNLGLVILKPYFSLWAYGSGLDPALYQGTWDPTTDTPAIPAADSGNEGWWYVASVAGDSTTPIINTWPLGRVITSNGISWSPFTVLVGNGLTSYGDLGSNLDAFFYSYNFASGQNSNLTDAEYRLVIKLKAILNANDGTLASIMAYLNQFFPGTVFLTDNKDMTMAYLVYSTVPLSKELLEIYLPRPMGVGITVTIINPPTPGGEDRLTTEDGDILTTEDGTPLITEPSS